MLKIIEAISFILHGEKLDRLSMDVNGNQVQVIRYNDSNEDVSVKVNNHVEQTTLEDVPDVIHYWLDE